jgi:hypothetical protein
MVQRTSSFGGRLKTIEMNATQTIATALTTGDQPLRLQGAVAGLANSPRLRRRFRKLSQIGIP